MLVSHKLALNYNATVMEDQLLYNLYANKQSVIYASNLEHKSSQSSILENGLLVKLPHPDNNE